MRIRLAVLIAVSLLAAALACTREPQHSSRVTPIFVISVDTLRADRLPAWGYHGVETPHLDALAADGIVFENAYSHVPLTLPAHVSMLTGKTPAEHGVRNNIGFRWDTAAHPSITSALRDAGYHTGAAVSAYVLRGATGMGDAFEFFEDAIASQPGIATGSLQRAGMATVAVAGEWIDRQSAEPMFFLLHLFEPHSPYEAPEPFGARYADRPYDGEIAAADAAVGAFLDHLRRRGLYDRSAIILLSDHGEGLGDHGEQEHGVFLYREAIHVPLILKLPGASGAGERVREPVQLADLAATIADLSGVRWDRGEGLSLLDPLPPDRIVVSETFYPRFHLGWSEIRSAIDDRYHYIEAPRPELFDIRADRAERHDILAIERRASARMRESLAAVPKEIGALHPIDPSEAEKLAALGYIGSVREEVGPLPDPKDRIAELESLRSGARLASEGRTADAIAVYRSVLERNPRFGDAWTLLARALEEMGRLGEAIEAYENGIRSSPALADEMALSAAALMLRDGRPAAAAELARLALDTAPAAARLLVARAALEQGSFAEAEREALAAMEDGAVRSSAAVVRAQAIAGAGKPEEALSMLLALRAGGERVENLELALGDLFARRSEWAEAESALLREIEHFPSNLRGWTSLAVVYVLSGRPGKVDPLLERMVSSNEGPLARHAAATTLEALGDERGAERWRATK